MISVLIAAGGLVFTGLQFLDQQQQFVQTSQQARYNDILSGLSDPSAAAQIAAISRLVDFVADSDNFSDSSDQQRVGKELERTLVQYIRSTADTTAGGLKEYGRLPQRWVLAATATQQLQLLLNNPQLATVRLQSLDLSLVDLHGYAQQNLHVSSNLTLDGVDLREASLDGIHVDSRVSLNLSQADLTCADLNGTKVREASLGHANLSFADLTGADLKNLDLSGVTGLTTAQFRHASWNKRTRWPVSLSGLRDTDGDEMQRVHGLCTYMIDRMTGMVPGEGYDNVTPYPLGPRFSAVQRHALTVKRLREGCIVYPRSLAVDPRVLFDMSDRTVVSLVRTCPR